MEGACFAKMSQRGRSFVYFRKAGTVVVVSKGEIEHG
jgi:hypothetical protein